MDVDNKEDYAEMAKKLISEEPQKVKVFVDMKNVEKLPVSTARNEVIWQAKIAEHQMMRLLIIKKWGNSYDNSVTYVHQSGMEIPCTPAMIKDWARTMYDGEATTTVPPNIPYFDPAKCEPALHPMRRSTVVTSTPASTSINTTDINSLTSMLLLQTVQDLTCETTTPLTPHPAQATTSLPVPGIISPPALTPSMLTRFLKHAEDHLGVAFATTYESSLCGIGAGPDILAEMADQDLVRVGLSAALHGGMALLQRIQQNIVALELALGSL
ncbi:uncharacterized protein F5147DRAFT_651002 [Suillus discolor]|uniref:Uncharacterized protein n=1 Tax=Suillus discolor TaxID=1912936 RepID=A0A9P7FD91_9AGAM|nr:uncharacterized protein F5147DRAFT_651002 [Suillus discolor]KAG2112368.1 hypothetical protein F5147DRAFT_651002 [Suillus discolor]